eukprot:Unigene8439_Nuclearia_a/m.25841 Unigene8439_Nuclearia_a/g.25841  ORF Unigene8439_Nuclearia_a/g.25841 Unigene8439_Nuclearia_a/m.25841 type:complete len:233 (-) Unigene8439_Nuclearia_a:75-773(-)
MSATLQTVIGVYVVTGESVKDFYQRVPVSTKTTVADVVKAMVAQLFGNESHQKYTLYEAEYVKGATSNLYVAVADHVAKTDDDLMFLKGETITVTKKMSDELWVGECEGIVGKFPAKLVQPKDGKAKIDDTTSRKLIRVLRDTEIPLFVQYNWKYQNNSSNLTFVLQEREVEIRENASKEVYVSLSATKLQQLLSDLEAQESRAIAEVSSKYDKQSETYNKALSEARAKARK